MKLLGGQFLQHNMLHIGAVCAILASYKYSCTEITVDSFPGLHAHGQLLSLAARKVTNAGHGGLGTRLVK